jgi:heat shock protein HslJ
MTLVPDRALTVRLVALAGAAAIPFAVIALAVSGFFDTPVPRPVALDSSWKLLTGTVDGAQVPLAAGYRITATVRADSISGSTGCNSYGATLQQPDGSAGIGDLIQTTAGCGGPPGPAERAYLAAVRRISSFAMDGAELVITGPGVELRYAALPELQRQPFAGTNWTLQSLIDHDAARAPAAPGSLLLRADGTFQAFTGCRDLVGTWVVSGDMLATPAIDALGECRVELTKQDGQVIGVLEAAVARLDGDSLLLTANGSLGLVYHRASTGD